MCQDGFFVALLPGASATSLPPTQLPHGFRVADTLMAIFKDNRVLLEGMDEEVLTCFVRCPPPPLLDHTSQALGWRPWWLATNGWQPLASGLRQAAVAVPLSASAT